MICEKHDRVVRAGHCPLCIDEIEAEQQLAHDIYMLEKEIKQPIQLWPVIS